VDAERFTPDRRPLDIVCPGLTGELYPAEDDAALRRAGLTRVCSPALRQRYGALARELVLPRSWESLGDEPIGTTSA
jgi:phosphatidylinositol alpha 1,6-mannosyltransferase